MWISYTDGVDPDDVATIVFDLIASAESDALELTFRTDFLRSLLKSVNTTKAIKSTDLVFLRLAAGAAYHEAVLLQAVTYLGAKQSQKARGLLSAKVFPLTALVDLERDNGKIFTTLEFERCDYVYGKLARSRSNRKST